MRVAALILVVITAASSRLHAATQNSLAAASSDDSDLKATSVVNSIAPFLHVDPLRIVSDDIMKSAATDGFLRRGTATARRLLVERRKNKKSKDSAGKRGTGPADTEGAAGVGEDGGRGEGGDTRSRLKKEDSQSENEEEEEEAAGGREKGAASGRGGKEGYSLGSSSPMASLGPWASLARACGAACRIPPVLLAAASTSSTTSETTTTATASSSSPSHGQSPTPSSLSGLSVSSSEASALAELFFEHILSRGDPDKGHGGGEGRGGSKSGLREGQDPSPLLLPPELRLPEAGPVLALLEEIWRAHRHHHRPRPSLTTPVLPSVTPTPLSDDREAAASSTAMASLAGRESSAGGSLAPMTERISSSSSSGVPKGEGEEEGGVSKNHCSTPDGARLIRELMDSIVGLKEMSCRREGESLTEEEREGRSEEIKRDRMEILITSGGGDVTVSGDRRRRGARLLGTGKETGARRLRGSDSSGNGDDDDRGDEGTSADGNKEEETEASSSSSSQQLPFPPTPPHSSFPYVILRRLTMAVLQMIHMQQQAPEEEKEGEGSLGLGAAAEHGRACRAIVEEVAPSIILSFAGALNCSRVSRVALELLHVSKSGGTSMCQLAQEAGFTNPNFNPQRNCEIHGFHDAPKWTQVEKGLQPEGDSFHSGPAAKCPDWAEEPRPSCQVRASRLQAEGINFYANERALHDGRDEGGSSHACAAMESMVVLRDGVDRTISHVVEVDRNYQRRAEDTGDNKYQRSRDLTEWRQWAPAVLDNYIARSLLGRHFICRPFGTLEERDLLAASLTLSSLDHILILGVDDHNDVILRAGVGWSHTLKNKHYRFAARRAGLDEALGFPPDYEAELSASNQIDTLLMILGQLHLRLDVAFHSSVAALLLPTASPEGEGEGEGGGAEAEGEAFACTTAPADDSDGNSVGACKGNKNNDHAGKGTGNNAGSASPSAPSIVHRRRGLRASRTGNGQGGNHGGSHRGGKRRATSSSFSSSRSTGLSIRVFHHVEPEGFVPGPLPLHLELLPFGIGRTLGRAGHLGGTAGDSTTLGASPCNRSGSMAGSASLSASFTVTTTGTATATTSSQREGPEVETTRGEVGTRGTAARQVARSAKRNQRERRKIQTRSGEGLGRDALFFRLPLYVRFRGQKEING